MDSAQKQEQSSATRCLGGCGFYGSDATQGFCSVCWKAHQSSAALAAASSPSQPAAAAAAASPPETHFAETAPAQQAEEAAPPAVAEPAVEAAAAVPCEPADEKPVQENRGRCFSCRKKVGLLGFECRCGYVFCSGHRHAADHACPFDYAAFDKANLAKANNKVVAAKVDKL